MPKNHGEDWIFVAGENAAPAGTAPFRAAFHVRAFAVGIIDPRRDYLPKLILLIGLAYPFLPLDLIPNRIPVVGYLDQAAFVLGGIALAFLRFREGGMDGAAWRRAAPRRAPASLRQRLRALLLDGFAMMFAVPLLRLSTGSWPRPADVAVFRRAFQGFTPLPPLMRALASLPSGREHLTRAMLTSWLAADPAYQGALRAELTGDDRRLGNRLRVWSGAKVAFLHLEKTAGMSLVAALAEQFHPLQIDDDLRRAFPPHVLTPLPPFLLPRVRRCAFVWGHYDLPSLRRLGPDRFTFTVLREPAARVVSLYLYWRGQAALDLGWNGMNQPVLAAQRLTLAEFLHATDPFITNYIDNFYVRRLTGLYATEEGDPLLAHPDDVLDQALAALDSLDYVGLTEDADGCLAQLGERLGFTPPRGVPRLNVTRPSPESGAAAADPVVQAALTRLTRLDQVVYEAARRRYAGI
jgi:uncharacterized membrane protein YkvA (DUF1232 family)